MPLILASASPRRRALLQNLGVSFEVRVSQVEENIKTAWPPPLLAEELARLKAWDVAQGLSQGLIIGADTMVVAAGHILGKPASKQEARQMLAALSGQEHQVITGLALVNAADGRQDVLHEITRVWFRSLTADEIERYINSGEPMDKAGAYGIQGKGSLLVEKIEGCYFNVVGLPLTALYLLLKKQGFNLL